MMIKKVLILGFILYFSACVNKQSSTTTSKAKGSSMLLEKIIQNIKNKATKIVYKLPPHEVVTLKNKLKIIFMKDNLPYIHFKLRLDAGKRYESIDGTSDAVVSLLDKGTGSLSREEILDALDKIGASFSANAGQEFSWVEASGLAKNDITLMNLFWKLLTESIFLEEEWEKEKQIILTGLERLPNSSDSFLRKVFSDFSYKGSFYKGESRKSIQSLSRRDLVKFYTQHYQPASASLLVLGQYTEELKKAIIQKFSNWQVKSSIQSIASKNQTAFSSPITLIHKSDSVQANVIIGMPVNLPSGHPDILAAKLANFILGDGNSFNARLIERVRKKDGLTYSIYSYFSSLKDTGTFQIITSTNQGSLGKLLKSTFEEVTQFYKNGISQAELDFAKLYYSNSLFRSLEKKETLMDAFLNLSGFGRDPVAHFETFSSRVEVIDLVTVNKMVKKYFIPKNMKIFVLANKDSQGGEANPKNKGKFTIVEQLQNFSVEFPSYKGLDIKDYESISY